MEFESRFLEINRQPSSRWWPTFGNRGSRVVDSVCAPRLQIYRDLIDLLLLSTSIKVSLYQARNWLKILLVSV